MIENGSQNWKSKTLGVLLLAGGSSTRMKGQDKMLLQLNHAPILTYSLKSFLSIQQTKQIVIVARKDLLSYFSNLVENLNSHITISVVEGGKTRQESVFAGIAKLKGFVDFYAIHDGARPLIHPDDIENCFKGAAEVGGATLATPVTDTIKLVDKDYKILETLPRDFLYNIETPQIFEKNVYHRGMELAIKTQKNFTDDCQLMEESGQPVIIVQSQHPNLKLTLLEDIPVFQQLLKRKEK